MQIKELTKILKEAPIGDIEFYGSQKPKTFHKDDIGIVNSPKGRAKIRRVLEKAPILINLIFINDMPYNQKIPGERGSDDFLDYHVSKCGLYNREQISDQYAVFIPENPNALTVVFTFNDGDNRHVLSPWTIAHRIMHALFLANIYNFEIRQIIAKFNHLISDCPSDVIDPATPCNIGDLLFQIGKFKSARDGQIGDVGEFVAEMFAQYLITGDITFNKVPRKFLSKLTARAKVNYPNLTDGHERIILQPEFLDRKFEEIATFAKKVFYNALQDCKGQYVLL